MHHHPSFISSAVGVDDLAPWMGGCAGVSPAERFEKGPKGWIL